MTAFRSTIFALFAFLLLSTASATALQIEGPFGNWKHTQNSDDPKHLFGKWGGLRPWLSNHGLELHFDYRNEPAYNAHGGKTTGGTYVDQFTGNLALDWGKMAGSELNGFSTHVLVIHRDGDNASKLYVGDNLIYAQEIFGGANKVNVKLVDLYNQHKFANGKLVLKYGRLPVMNDFGTLPDGCYFMALALCTDRALSDNLGWTVVPYVTWGGMASYSIAHNWTIKSGGYEVNPNLGGPGGLHFSTSGSKGVNIPVELDANPKFGSKGLPGVYKIGGYYDTSNYNEWYRAANGQPLPIAPAGVPPATDKRAGFYLVAEQKISQPDTNNDQGLAVLAGYAYNTPATATFEHFAFLGLIDKGLVPGRPNDFAGVSFAYARVSHNLTAVQRQQATLSLPLSSGAPGIHTDETYLEANYKLRVVPGMTIMPDLQYVIRPSGTNTYPNALVLGIQATVNF